MFDGLGSEMNLIIDNLCTKFGTTVEELLPELCKYKVYQSVGYIAAFSILGLLDFLDDIVSDLDEPIQLLDKAMKADTLKDAKHYIDYAMSSLRYMHNNLVDEKRG